MVFYVNGCSHTWGSVVKHDETYPHIIMRSIVGDDYQTLDINPKQVNHEETIKLLSQIRSDKHYLINASTSGKGNAMISNETIHHLLLLESLNIKIKFAIIQFSGQSRNFYITPDGDVRHTSPHEEPEKGLLFNPYGGLHSLLNIYSVQEVLKNKNIEFVIVPYHSIESSDKSELFEKDCFDLDNFTTHPNEGHREDFMKRGLAGDEPGHPDYFGNFFLASICLDKMGYGDSIIPFKQFYHNYDLGNMIHQNLDTKKFNRKYLNDIGDEGDVETLRKIKK